MDKIIIEGYEYTCSDIHLSVLQEMLAIVEEEKDMECIKDILHNGSFCYEGIHHLQNCEILDVFTASSSGFDIVGVTLVKYIGVEDQIFVRNIFH